MQQISDPFGVERRCPIGRVVPARSGRGSACIDVRFAENAHGRSECQGRTRKGVLSVIKLIKKTLESKLLKCVNFWLPIHRFIIKSLFSRLELNIVLNLLFTKCLTFIK